MHATNGDGQVSQHVTDGDIQISQYVTDGDSQISQHVTDGEDLVTRHAAPSSRHATKELLGLMPQQGICNVLLTLWCECSPIPCYTWRQPDLTAWHLQFLPTFWCECSSYTMLQMWNGMNNTITILLLTLWCECSPTPCYRCGQCGRPGPWLRSCWPTPPC